MTRQPTIGALSHRLVLEYAQRKPDGAGGFTTSWLALADVWASIEAGRGGEAVEADGIKGRRALDVIVRVRPEIVPSRRFRFGARLLDITGVEPIGEGRAFLRCRCTERNL